MIEIRGLWFSYGGIEPSVLRDVSLSLRSRAVTALLGPNGSGKTTLLHLLLGWRTPDRGDVELSGKNVRRLSGGERSRLVGLVSQNEPTGLELSVPDYVLLGRISRRPRIEPPGKADREAAAAALAAAGLSVPSGRSVRELSAGERQLASIARVLAQDPAVLLLDEPTSHLDLGNTRRIMAIIDGLRRAGKTLVLTTHDPTTAADLADDVVLLRGGEVIASGPAESTLTAERLSAAYGIEVEVRRIEGRSWIRARWPRTSSAAGDRRRGSLFDSPGDVGV